MDTQDLPFYHRNRCKLFLYEQDFGRPFDLDLQFNVCDNLNAAYPLPKPKYRICTRNFVNLLDEIEKVDYNFEEVDDSSDDEA